MSLLKKRPDSGALISVLILLVLLAYLIAFGIINFPGFAYFCTTDMYEDTLVARLMWEQKTLFPENFLFGNQFYVIATPVLAALFYGLCGSMNLAMGLATTVMSILILLSLNWMLKAFIKEAYVRYAALLALVAASFGPQTVVREDGQLFFVMCSFYACYLISFFVLMGDYARARESGQLRPLAFALSLFLCFCTGMQSLRQTCVSILPIICFEGIEVFFRLIKRSPILPKERRASFIRSLSYLAANVAGILFIRILGISRNEIYYGQSIFSGASIREKISATHEALITVSGFDFTREGNHFFFVLLFLFFTLLIIFALFTMLRKRDFGSGTACFWWLTIISIAGVIAASFVTSVSLRPIYLFPYYTLPALSFAVVSLRLKDNQKNLLCLILCIFAFANIYFSYNEEIRISLDPPETPGKQICDFAMENGYSIVYGSHSHTAPYVAVYSDGEITAGCWNDNTIFSVSPHINAKYVYFIESYQKAIFVFLTEELEAAFAEIEPYGIELEFHGQFGDYHLYTSPQQLMYPISENIDFVPAYN